MQHLHAIDEDECVARLSSYTLYSDVFVYLQPTDPQRKSRSLAVDGPPLLAIEVVTDSTARNDLDEGDGKVYVYGAAGVREYLVFDPTGEYLPERVRAWRKEDAAFIPWTAEGNGRWRSRDLGVSFAVESLLLRVYAPDGTAVLFDQEVRQALEDARRRAAGQERG